MAWHQQQQEEKVCTVCLYLLYCAYIQEHFERIRLISIYAPGTLLSVLSSSTRSTHYNRGIV